MSNTTEFGGWPRPPRWAWAIAAVATVAALAGVVIARTGPHRATPTSAVMSPAAGPSHGDLRMPPRRPARMTGQPLPRAAYAGAFSPDGRLLALQVTARIGASRQPSAARLVVAVVATGSLMAVPGTTIGSGIGG